jgi:hypothetical protein
MIAIIVIVFVFFIPKLIWFRNKPADTRYIQEFAI